MRDRAFFSAVLDAAARSATSTRDVLWSYAILHRDARAAREYLRHADEFVARVRRAALDSPLARHRPGRAAAATSTSSSSRSFNARAHRFGQRRDDPATRDLARQYRRLLAVLGYRAAARRRRLARASPTTCCCRTASRRRSRLRAGRRRAARRRACSTTTCARTSASSRGDARACARGIAERYRDYPVEHWREALPRRAEPARRGRGQAPSPATRRPHAAADRARGAPSPRSSSRVEAGRVASALPEPRAAARCATTSWTSSSRSRRSPFVQQGGRPFGLDPAQPRETQGPAGRAQRARVRAARAQFHGSNVLVEVRGAGLDAQRRPTSRTRSTCASSRTTASSR